MSVNPGAFQVFDSAEASRAYGNIRFSPRKNVRTVTPKPVRGLGFNAAAGATANLAYS